MTARTSPANGHYVVISADGHAGNEIHGYRDYLEHGVPRRVRPLGRDVRVPVPRSRRSRREPQLGQRPAPRRDGGRRHRRRGAVPEHRPALLPEVVAHRASARGRRRRARAPVGGAARAQPVARRLLRGDAGPARRDRADPPHRRRRGGRRRSAGRATRACPVACCSRARHPAPVSRRSTRRRTTRSGRCAKSSACRSTTTRAARCRRWTRPPMDKVVFLLEVTWWAHRALSHLVFGGVLERFPHDAARAHRAGHRVDPRGARAPRLLLRAHALARRGSQEVEWGSAVVSKLSLKPSEYWARQCHVGASFIRPAEVPLRSTVGVDRIMWGSDYPHKESSYPYSHEALRLSFAGVDAHEVQVMVGANAADLYGFDLEALAPIAATCRPDRRRDRRPDLAPTTSPPRRGAVRRSPTSATRH